MIAVNLASENKNATSVRSYGFCHNICSLCRKRFGLHEVLLCSKRFCRFFCLLKHVGRVLRFLAERGLD